MQTSQIKRVTATGDITTSSAHIRCVVLTGGADAATALIKAGGSGGTAILTVAAAAGVTASVPLPDVYCAGGIHVTLTGTTPPCTVVYV
jgi:hypothetical protein